MYQAPWKEMKDAPKDGTAILVMLEGSDIPCPVCWFVQSDIRPDQEPGWYTTWDHYRILDIDGPLCWMPCPPVEKLP